VYSRKGNSKWLYSRKRQLKMVVQ